MSTDRVAIVAGLRTPFAKAGTGLRKMKTVDLAIGVVKELVERAEIAPKDVTLVVYGQVVPTLDWLNIAREVVLGSGLPKDTDAFSVSRACATSIQAMTDAAQAIQAGHHEIAIAGGADSMSDVPLGVSRPLRDALVSAQKGKTLHAKLAPVFDRNHGTITAANSSPLTDGASALLMMKESRAKAMGYEPLGYLRSWAYAAVDPGWQLLMAPVFAFPKALERAGLTLSQ